MATTFSAIIKQFEEDAVEKTEAVFKQSAQEIVEIAQRKRAEGGNMPVDTGFLRASGRGSLNSPPSGGARVNPYTEPNSVEADEQAFALVVSRATVYDSIYHIWTAEYARAMENKYAFVRLAAQQWPDVVKRNADRIS